MENYHFIDPLKFLSEATSPYQTVIKSAEILKENGFEELELDQDWKLEPGTDYFVKVYGSTLVAFHFGKNLRSRSYRFSLSQDQTECGNDHKKLWQTQCRSIWRYDQKHLDRQAAFSCRKDCSEVE